MGKIFDALQLHTSGGKSRNSTCKLMSVDCHALLKHDPQSGILDLTDSDIAGEQDSIKRLIKNGLIDARGRLTRKGFRVCKQFRGMQAVKRAAAPQERLLSPTLPSRPEVVKRGAAGREELPDEKAASAPPPPREKGRPAVALVRDKAPGSPSDDGEPTAGASDHDLVVLHNPESVEAEQFRKLRSSIMFPNGGPAPRLILVTSTAPGEGKSFVAANLAATIAMNPDRHVLLVDSDLRHPTIHRLLGLTNKAGLSDHLGHRQELAQLIQRVALPRMSVVTAGAHTANPAELLTSERMIRFLDEVRERYDDRLVVLDSPPATVAAELNVLAGFADGILLVLKEGGPKREEVLGVVEQLGKKKILGLVGNFASERSSGYYARNKYYRQYYQQYHQG